MLHHGTPVGLMSVVDPSAYDAPETATVPGGIAGQRQTPTCNRITLYGYNSGGAGGLPVVNTKNVYVVRKPAAGGSGGAIDSGVLVAIVPPGGSATLPESGGFPITSLSPYRYFLDSEVDNEGAYVVLWGVG